MDATLFIFGTDLLHEGFDAVLANVQERAGAHAVALAATYHDARDVLPHNPRFHVYRHQGDIAWFAPQRARYASGLAPQLADAAEGRDVLAELCQAADARGMQVDAWTIFLHNSVLAAAQPDCATRNVYGDAYLTDLCPANPRVRQYSRELAADVVRYPVRRLLAESLHYRPLEHGEHHERYLLWLPPEARALLALCFCPHCREAGERAGVRVGPLGNAIRAGLEPVWRGELPHGATPPLLPADARSELDAYVAVRMATVASLVGEVRDAMRPSSVELSFIDHAGGMSHVMAGTSADDEVLLAARRLGIAPAAVAANCDEYAILGYVDTPQRLHAMLASYAQALPAGTRRSIALRPLHPDCHDPANLRAKLDLVRRSGAAGVGFYHYAMMPLGRLDWVRAALKEVP